MASWILVPCLAQLRDEFNLVAPGRAKGADGSIGDTAHAGGGVSDHLPDEDFSKLRGKDADSRNEVHALDITTDLRTPGLTLEMVVQHLLARCRSGAERRLRYIIFNRRIWHVDEGWRQQTYTGTSDPHTGHAHFSASYDTAREASTASWHLEDIPVALTDEDRQWVATEIREAIADAFALRKQSDGTPTSAAGAAVLSQGIPNGLRAGTPREPRDNAWEVFRDLGAALVAMQKGVDLAKAAGPEVAKVRSELADVAADVKELLAKQPAADHE
jgi:hypothetical protein